MSRVRGRAFAAAFAVQALLVGDRAWLLATGTEIRLSAIPVDPRDLFRGDYVVLDYAVAHIGPGTPGDATFAVGEPIYVTLARDGDDWRVGSVHRADPGSGTVLRGVVTAADCTPACRYTVDYGLGRFFVPEGEGRALENRRDGGRLAVDVAVGAGGRAALKRLLVDGTVRYEDGIF